MNEQTNASTLDGSAVLRIVNRPALFLDYNEQSSVLIDPEAPDWVKTSATGKWLYETLAATAMSPDQLVEAAAEYYGLPAGAVVTPVRSFVETLLSHGFLQHDSQPAPARPQAVSDAGLLRDDLPAVGLTAVWFNLLSQCNLRCEHCFLPESGADKPISVADARRIIDTLAQQGVRKLYLSGGEPLLHHGLEEIVAYARSRADWLLFIITNGTSDDLGLVERLCDAVDYFQVSVDGVDAATHDAVRRAGSFAKAIRFIQRVNATRQRAKICLSFTPHPLNVTQIPQLFRFGMDLGVHSINVTKPKRPARHSTAADPAHEQFLSHEFRRQVYAQYDELVLGYLHQVKGLSTYRNITIPSIDSSFDPALNLLLCVGRACCGAGASTLFIDEKGDCYPCVALIRPEYHLGNVLREPFETVYQGRAIQGFRQSVHVDRIEGCSRCSFKYFCAGDCRALGEDAHDRTPYCDIVQERYHRLLRGVRAGE